MIASSVRPCPRKQSPASSSGRRKICGFTPAFGLGTTALAHGKIVDLSPASMGCIRALPGSSGAWDVAVELVKISPLS